MEILQSDGSAIVEMINKVMQRMDEQGDALVNKICHQKLKVCQERPKLPSTPSKCQACNEVVNLFGFKLR